MEKEIKEHYSRMDPKVNRVSILADLYAITTEDVRRILGIQPKNRRSKIRAMEFWEMCEKGCSDAEIARYFGVTKQAANNYRNRNNAKRIAVC